jgi:hypothetical protein
MKRIGAPKDRLNPGRWGMERGFAPGHRHARCLRTRGHENSSTHELPGICEKQSSCLAANRDRIGRSLQEAMAS